MINSLSNHPSKELLPFFQPAYPMKPLVQESAAITYCGGNLQPTRHIDSCSTNLLSV